MKTAIVYISKHGTTEKIVKSLAEKIGIPDKDIYNLRVDRNPDISNYDIVLIGGSIHAGMIQKRVKDFCENNIDMLLQKETGLFMSGMQKESLKEEFENAFNEKLRTHSKAYAFTGGEFIFEKMNFLEKAIVRKVANIDKTVSEINNEEIDKFASAFI